MRDAEGIRLHRFHDLFRMRGATEDARPDIAVTLSRFYPALRHGGV
jgi:hypothetical protein